MEARIPPKGANRSKASRMGKDDGFAPFGGTRAILRKESGFLGFPALPRG